MGKNKSWTVRSPFLEPSISLNSPLYTRPLSDPLFWNPRFLYLINLFFMEVWEIGIPAWLYLELKNLNLYDLESKIQILLWPANVNIKRGQNFILSCQYLLIWATAWVSHDLPSLDTETWYNWVLLLHGVRQIQTADCQSAVCVCLLSDNLVPRVFFRGRKREDSGNEVGWACRTHERERKSPVACIRDKRRVVGVFCRCSSSRVLLAHRLSLNGIKRDHLQPKKWNWYLCTLDTRF